MRKIYSLLRLGLPVALFCAFASNAHAGPASIMGEYTFNADVTYADGVSDDWKQAFPASFDFTITERSMFNASPMANNFVLPNSKVNIDYDATAGTIKNAVWAYLTGDITFNGTEYWIGLSDAEGTTLPTEYDFQWNVDANGVITFPTFTLVVYTMDLATLEYSVEQIIATYTNGSTGNGGGNGDGDDDGDDTGSYPASIMGNYSFSANVEYADGIEAEWKTNFPASFNFDITERSEFNSNPMAKNFVLPNSKVNIDYDATTGNIKNAVWAYLTGDITFNGTEYWIGLSDAEGKTLPTEYDFQWSVNSKGTISFPTFTLVVYKMDLATLEYYVERIIATYTDGKATTGSQGGGDVVTNHDFSNETATYNWYKTVNGETTQEVMTLAFNANNQIAQIAGYTTSNTALEYGYMAGTVKGNVWSRDAASPAYVDINELNGDAILISSTTQLAEDDSNGDSTPVQANIKVTYQDGNYILEPTTLAVWKRSIVTSGSVGEDEGNDDTTGGGESSAQYTLLSVWSSEEPVVPQPPVEEVDADFSGIYTISGTKVDYTANEAETSVEFTLTINDYNELAELLGYTGTLEALSNGYNKFDVTETSYTLTKGMLQEAGAYVDGVTTTEAIALGSASTTAYDANGGFTLTKDGDNYSITNLTVWSLKEQWDASKEANTTVGTLQALYKDLTITNVADYEEAEGNSDFAHTYTGIGDRQVDPSNFGYEEYDIPFSMTINGNNELTAIAEFTAPKLAGEVVGGNWVLNCTPDTRITDEDGTEYILSGRGTAWDDEMETSITLYPNEDGTFRLQSFSIWDTDYEECLYVWTSLNKLEVETEEPGEDEEIFGTSCIEGTWDFTLNGHYLGDYSLGEFTEEFEATLDGNTVTFESAGSQYHIVAKFTAENTLSFDVAMVGNPAASFILHHHPYVNEAGVEDIEELDSTPFSATYDSASQTITFPANSGLRYGYFDKDGGLGYWDDAYDFVSAKKKDVQAAVEVIGSEDAKPVYFDLNGRRVNNPDKGIYIKVAGDKVSKVIVR